MPAEVDPFEILAAKFRRLGGADRRAVLAKLSASERRAFERRLAAQAEEERRKLAEERRADRRFARYSQSIAAKVERAVQGDTADEAGMTQACAAALARVHQAAEDLTEPSGLVQFLRKLGLAPLFAANGAGK
jgi:hypothetical protein